MTVITKKGKNILLQASGKLAELLSQAQNGEHNEHEVQEADNQIKITITIRK